MINVRDATDEDAPEVVDLIQELARNGGDTSPITEEYVRHYLASPSSHILLAIQDEEALGLLSYSIRPNLYHAGDSAYIEELVARESARGQGVGSALLSDVMERLTNQGCVEVSISTMPDNEGAQRLYKRHGLVDEAVFLEKHL